ncbi:hypothetical protein R1sor_025693 [Riccia sorocarpa]|uniref:Uncharacterized protein n=1 Tax=Riccia sorocarpa TaxID=122646 RepID=A0ABD3GCJ6_9MARC
MSCSVKRTRNRPLASSSDVLPGRKLLCTPAPLFCPTLITQERNTRIWIPLITAYPLNFRWTYWLDLMATVTWKEGTDSYWEVTGGILRDVIRVTPVDLKQRIPEYSDAVTKFCESNEEWSAPEDGVQLLGRAAFALTESELPRKRFQVYRALAFFFGYKDRTELPPTLEKAVKAMWSMPEEIFVGFREV